MAMGFADGGGTAEMGNLGRLALGVDFISLENSGRSMTELISWQCLFYMDAMGSQLHDGRLLGTAHAWCCESFVLRMTNRIGYSEAGQGPQLLSRLFRLWAVNCLARGPWRMAAIRGQSVLGWMVGIDSNNTMFVNRVSTRLSCGIYSPNRLAC